MSEINLADIWKERRLMPAVAIDCITGKVLMVGYMNKEAFAYTLKTHRAHYFDIDDGSVNMKGKHSGDTQKIISIKLDNEKKSLLLSVEQKGFVCHDGEEKYNTTFIYELYRRHGGNLESVKHKKFDRVEVDENFDYSKEDYESDND
ncbi:MAG: hypothetical protein KBT46_05660 [Ruminococcus sp.]|nr:hypothetical protein [Candidatus Copronaster equi]